jgi:NADPH-dependent glutamate synthase beta subunit-like oxidoreductase/coenzyme F420-reducing hydrogenase delta subunit
MSDQTPNPNALVVGHGPAEAQAALDLAQAGAGVTLLTSADWLTPGDEGPAAKPALLEAVRHPHINLVSGATVKAIQNGASNLRVSVQQSPRYVDAARCTACGACVEVCPVLLPGENGAAHTAIYRGGVPTAYAIDKAGMAPCRHACPIDQRAQGYVALIRAGDFQAAYHTIKQDNPFPSVCGRVCNHRCEQACTRCEVDEPVAVMALKRFVTDWAFEAGVKIKANIAPRTDRRVAIVGAGPAGLTAARELNRLGHDVTVLEALPVPGGMMRVGIPGFRLARERLNWDIDEILAEGVELRTNTRVENVENLFAEGYDAVVLAVGLHASMSLSIPGAEEPGGTDGDWPGVMGAVEFLRQVNLGERPDWRGKQVIVVGGGSTAMDTARFCRRLGAEVTVVYRRSRAEMPAHDFEVDDARREGVKLRLLSNPVKILRQDGQMTAVECIQMELGEPDESGRRRPIPIEGSEFTLPADQVLLAIGQVSDLSLLPESGPVTQHKGIVHHNPATLMTARPGLFVAGDVAGSDGFVVDAIATGLQVARSADHYLQGTQSIAEPVLQPAVQLGEPQIAERLSWAAPQGSARARTRSTLPATLLGDFGETETGLSEAEAITEAARCLSCGLCSECLACVKACPANAINHEQQARVFELHADAVVIGNWGLGIGEWGLESEDSGVFGAHGEVDLATAVGQALNHLGLTRAAPTIDILAPSRRQAIPDTQHPQSPGGPLPGIPNTQHPQLGVFLCRCGGEIARTVDLTAVAARVEGLPGVTWVEQVEFACHPQESQAIRSAMAHHHLDGAVLAACSCCALDQICYSCTTQRIRCKERLGIWDQLKGLPLQFANVREQCAFVHRDAPDAATLKAGDLVAASIAALSLANTQHLHLGQSVAQVQVSLIPNTQYPTPITASIDPIRCRGCEDCEIVCGLEAMHVVGADGARFAQVDPARCLGCGVCLAVCSSGAILAGDTSDAQAEAMLAAMGDLSDKTLVLSCNWGAFSAVEAAGVQKLAYDASVRLMRLMCAGRVHEGLILRAFAQGAARVLVLSCGHKESESANQRDVGESLCHYHTGNDQAAKSVAQAQKLLALLGIDPARLALAEMRPGDGARFVAVVSEAQMTRKSKNFSAGIPGTCVQGKCEE